MEKGHRSRDREHAEREDELHDPKGKSAYSPNSPRYRQPNQEPVVGRPPRPHLHPQKSRPPKVPSLPVRAAAEAAPRRPSTTAKSTDKYHLFGVNGFKLNIYMVVLA